MNVLAWSFCTFIAPTIYIKSHNDVVVSSLPYSKAHERKHIVIHLNELLKVLKYPTSKTTKLYTLHNWIRSHFELWSDMIHWFTFFQHFVQPILTSVRHRHNQWHVPTRCDLTTVRIRHIYLNPTEPFHCPENNVTSTCTSLGPRPWSLAI